MWMLRVWPVLLLSLTALALPPRLTPTAYQKQATERLGPDARIQCDSLTGVPRVLLGISAPTTGKSYAERARGFLAQQAQLFGGIDTKNLSLVTVKRVGSQRTIIFQQTISSIPVEGRFIAVTMDNQARIRRVSSDFMPATLTTKRHDIGDKAARSIVKTRYAEKPVGKATRTVIVSAHGKAFVAYRFMVAILPPTIFYTVWVDAASGQIIQASQAGYDVPHLEVRP